LTSAKNEFKHAQNLDNLALKKKYSNEPLDKVVKDWEDRLVLEVDPSIDETIKGEFIQKHK
jgi:hypothetical protein